MKRNVVHLADRVHEIQPFHVMELLARARQMEFNGVDVVHMEIGEPDFTTPQPIIDAGMRAMAEGKVHYTPALGLRELRYAVSDYYRSHYGVNVSYERIVITPGASGALLLALAAMVGPGDQVLMTDPGYPCNRHFVRLLEGEAVGIPLEASENFHLSTDLLAEYWQERSVALMLASPANPTGNIIPPDHLKALADCVTDWGGRLIVDEIYQGLVYGRPSETVLQHSQEAFVINSFSKFFHMTGWRLGWMVVPEGYIEAVDRLAQNIFLAAPTVAQYAALAAFTPETLAVLENRRQEFVRRRDFLVPALRDLGFGIDHIPDGAFYVYASSQHFSRDSLAFSPQVLENTAVAITPGIDFGEYKAKDHVRFAYTTSLERLALGVERLKSYIK